MLKLKNKNGVTLVSLIITIIIMLILAGVVITVSIDGGQFSKAKEAGNKMQIAAETKEIQAAVLLAMKSNGKVDYNKIILPQGFTGAEGRYKSSSGNTFTVDEKGNVEYVEPKEIKLGDYVTYAGLTWRVIKNDSSGVELLSANAIGESTLTSNSSQWPYAITYIEGRLNANSQQAVGGIANVRSVTITDQPIAESLGLMAAGNEYFVNYYDTKPVEGDSDSEQYYTYSITSSGTINPIYLFTLKNGEVTDYAEFEKTACVRPVASLGAGALDYASGNGTSSQPYVIAD